MKRGSRPARGWSEHSREPEAPVETPRSPAETVLQIAKPHEGTGIHQANLQEAATQISELLREFDVTPLREKLEGDPLNYSRVVSVLVRLSETGLKYERYRAEMAEKKEQMMLDKSKEGAGLSAEGLANLEEKLHMM